MLSYDELADRNRKLEALLAAERDRAADEKQKREAAEEQRAIALRQLDDMRKLYAVLQQEHELLRRRIFEAKAERVDPTQLEIEFEKTKAALEKLQGELAAAAAAAGEDLPAPPPNNPRPKKKHKPKGRRNLDESTLPRESVVVSDPAMEELVAKGEAEVIGSDTSSQLMYRRGSFVVLQTEKPSYRLLKSEGDSATTLVTAQAPRSIIERSIGTPSLYAHIVVDKFDRGLPLYRQEEEFGQLDARIDRGTMSRWLEQLGGTVGATVLEAMRTEAFATAMCLSTDATGILVQRGRDPTTKARRACKKGHFFVQIADRDAVFFEYAERETSAAVLKMFRDFSGYIECEHDAGGLRAAFWSRCSRDNRNGPSGNLLEVTERADLWIVENRRWFECGTGWCLSGSSSRDSWRSMRRRRLGLGRQGAVRAAALCAWVTSSASLAAAW